MTAVVNGLQGLPDPRNPRASFIGSGTVERSGREDLPDVGEGVPTVARLLAASGAWTPRGPVPGDGAVVSSP
ncbi:hypothetical protein [Streptomyces sp. NPDC093094]|uniref:hypothetical protein n=1 Tax=Streptomyces sp. NPDC093094 TaxID=3366026 RepID=UPI0037F46D78